MAVIIAGYLEKRRAGYEAVRDVPPSLRAAVGRNRLRKGLGTRDLHLARARLLPALVAFEATIQAARRGSPTTDPIAAEALELRKHTLALKAGDATGWGVEPEWHQDESDGEWRQGSKADAALDIHNDGIRDRVEAIERQEGSKRAEAFAEVAMGRSTPLGLHVADWLAEPGQKGAYRGRTLDDYRRIIAEFGTWLAKEEHAAVMEKVTRRVAGRYLGTLHAEGLSSARIRTIVSALAGYWTWLERRGVIPEGVVNAWSRQAPPKAVNRGRQEPERAFENAEVVKLLAGAPDAVLGDLMRLAALSGLRIEEACKLTVGMCQGGRFDAPGTKTDASRRDVPIHLELAPMVAARCAGKAHGDWLLHELGEPNRYGERAAAISKRFGRYRQTVGVHERAEGQRRSLVNFHSFRRWFITKALQAGQPARVVQQVVGHRLQGMTEGVYFAGDTLEAKRACVAAVKLPGAS